MSTPRRALPDAPFLVIGHRGAAGLVAENTLPSFARALACGVPAVELDVYSVPGEHGGELVVIHDDTLERTTNGRGRVMDTPLEVLRGLDAGGGAAIPLLGEVLELVARDGAGAVAVNIELKGPATAAPVAALVAAGVEAGVVPGTDVPLPPLLVSSFDHRELAAFRALDGDTPVAPLFHKRHRDPVGVATGLGAWALNLSGRIVDAANVAAAHAAGLKVLVYTINKVEHMVALRGMGVDGVFTDHPDRLLAALAGA